MEGSHYDIFINHIDTILIDGKIGSTTKKISIYFAIFIFRFILQCFSFNLWNWSGKQKSDSAQTILWASFALKHFFFFSINYQKYYYYWVNDSLYIQIMIHLRNQIEITRKCIKNREDFKTSIKSLKGLCRSELRSIERQGMAPLFVLRTNTYSRFQY